jgi:hypothetical protein
MVGPFRWELIKEGQNYGVCTRCPACSRSAL